MNLFNGYNPALFESDPAKKSGPSSWGYDQTYYSANAAEQQPAAGWQPKPSYPAAPSSKQCACAQCLQGPWYPKESGPTPSGQGMMIMGANGSANSDYPPEYHRIDAYLRSPVTQQPSKPLPYSAPSNPQFAGRVPLKPPVNPELVSYDRGPDPYMRVFDSPSFMRKPTDQRHKYWEGVNGSSYPPQQYQFPPSCRYPPYNSPYYPPYPGNGPPPQQYHFPQHAQQPQFPPQQSQLPSQPLPQQQPSQPYYGIVANPLRQPSTQTSPAFYKLDNNSEVSRLRQMRKRKGDLIERSPSPRMTISSENAPLDVRRFLATWADEDDETASIPQMVVLDCQEINPEQAELLQMYEESTIRLVQESAAAQENSMRMPPQSNSENVQYLPESVASLPVVTSEETPVISSTKDCIPVDLDSKLDSLNNTASGAPSPDSPASLDSLPVIADLPTSEYRKNKFLDYDPQAFQTLPARPNVEESSAPSRPESAPALGRQEITDAKKGGKKRGRKPTIKFSIQKSHDLKISLRVMNESKSEEQPLVSEAVEREIGDDSNDTITLRLENGDGSEEGVPSKRSRKFKRRRLLESNYSVSSEAQCNEAESGGFQVKESVDSAKIKLTFKRRKDGSDLIEKDSEAKRQKGKRAKINKGEIVTEEEASECESQSNEEAPVADTTTDHNGHPPSSSLRISTENYAFKTSPLPSFRKNDSTSLRTPRNSESSSPKITSSCHITSPRTSTDSIERELQAIWNGGAEDDGKLDLSDNLITASQPSNETKDVDKGTVYTNDETFHSRDGMSQDIESNHVLDFYTESISTDPLLTSLAESESSVESAISPETTQRKDLCSSDTIHEELKTPTELVPPLPLDDSSTSVKTDPLDQLRIFAEGSFPSRHSVTLQETGNRSNGAIESCVKDEPKEGQPLSDLLQTIRKNEDSVTETAIQRPGVIFHGFDFIDEGIHLDKPLDLSRDLQAFNGNSPTIESSSSPSSKNAKNNDDDEPDETETENDKLNEPETTVVCLDPCLSKLTENSQLSSFSFDPEVQVDPLIISKGPHTPLEPYVSPLRESEPEEPCSESDSEENFTSSTAQPAILPTPDVKEDAYNSFKSILAGPDHEEKEEDVDEVICSESRNSVESGEASEPTNDINHVETLDNTDEQCGKEKAEEVDTSKHRNSDNYDNSNLVTEGENEELSRISGVISKGGDSTKSDVGSDEIHKDLIPSISVPETKSHTNDEVEEIVSEENASRNQGPNSTTVRDCLPMTLDNNPNHSVQPESVDKFENEVDLKKIDDTERCVTELETNILLVGDHEKKIIIENNEFEYFNELSPRSDLFGKTDTHLSIVDSSTQIEAENSANVIEAGYPEEDRSLAELGENIEICEFSTTEAQNFEIDAGLSEGEQSETTPFHHPVTEKLVAVNSATLISTENEGLEPFELESDENANTIMVSIDDTTSQIIDQPVHTEVKEESCGSIKKKFSEEEKKEGSQEEELEDGEIVDDEEEPEKVILDESNSALVIQTRVENLEDIPLPYGPAPAENCFDLPVKPVGDSLSGDDCKSPFTKEVLEQFRNPSPPDTPRIMSPSPNIESTTILQTFLSPVPAVICTSEVVDEPLPDEAQFQDVMENCLANAKKFIEGIEEDYPSDSVSDNNESQRTLDVLLSSREVISDLEADSDEVAVSFSPFHATLGSEILPVDNWPYLEEEVPLSPTWQSKDEDIPLIDEMTDNSSLQHPFLEMNFPQMEGNMLERRRHTLDTTSRSPRMVVNFLSERQVRETELDFFLPDEDCRVNSAMKLLARNETTFNYETSEWQPKVVVSRLSENAVKRISHRRKNDRIQPSGKPRRNLEETKHCGAERKYESQNRLKNKKEETRESTVKLNGEEVCANEISKNTQKHSESSRVQKERVMKKETKAHTSRKNDYKKKSKVKESTTGSEILRSEEAEREKIRHGKSKSDINEKQSITENASNAVKQRLNRVSERESAENSSKIQRVRSSHSVSGSESGEKERTLSSPVKERLRFTNSSAHEENLTSWPKLSSTKLTISETKDKNLANFSFDRKREKVRHFSLHEKPNSKLYSREKVVEGKSSESRRERRTSERIPFDMALSSGDDAPKDRTKESFATKNQMSRQRRQSTVHCDRTKDSLSSTSQLNTICDDDDPSKSGQPWVCRVCGFDVPELQEKHIQEHCFHCQSCLIAFASEADFIRHLNRRHDDIRKMHHCLLCELSFDTEVLYYEHIASREHRHLEAVEKNTIQKLFSMFSGEPCPVFGSIEPKPQWLPSQAGTVHFYHQATPLSMAVQYWKTKQNNQKNFRETCQEVFSK